MHRLSVTLFLPFLLAACGDEPSTPADAFPVPNWAKVAPEQIAEAKKHGVPVAFENDLGMRFVLIPAGTFLMGSPEDEEGRRAWSDESQRAVTIHRPFYVSITEVTNGQFRTFRPQHVSPTIHMEASGKDLDFDADDQPASGISWQDAAAFARSMGMRLPSEREWERAARGGLDGQAYPWGNRDNEALRNANGTADGYDATAPVASFPPNRYGLHDMVGNASEWCSDVWDSRANQLAIDVRADGSPKPLRPVLSLQRVIRGGDCIGGTTYKRRCATRNGAPESPDYAYPGIGFRLVSPLPAPGER